MADHAALGMRFRAVWISLMVKPRRARGDDDVGRQQLVQLAIECLLELDLLGPVLLDEIGAGDRLREIGRE